ncbi:FAD binding domain-containing protein [Aspergillus oleicola]
MRTMVIFDSFGFVDRVLKEASPMIELCPGASRCPQMTLHQGRTERFVLDLIESRSDICVECGVLPIKLEIDDTLVDSSDAYPITDGLFRSSLSADGTEELLKISALDAKANSEEVIKAKYMLGADGAHSWVRRDLGFTDYVWGVLDMVPITSFSDIRMKCTIQSADLGSILVIPRENKLVRLYIQLTTTAYNGGKKADRSKINPDVNLKAAQKILAPSELYQVDQGIGTQFSAHERVFLAGDAIHTHSPNSVQGMNTSMHDIASVIKGLTDRSILKTYELERRKAAQDLIAFDHCMQADGRNKEAMKETFEKNSLFLAGCGVDYGPSVIVTKGSEMNSVTSVQQLAPEIKVGMRVPSAKVLNQADGRPWLLQQRLPSDGRGRVIVFAGDVTKKSQTEKIERLGAALCSKVARYDAVIEILTVHAAPRKQVDIFDFPEVFRPFDDIEGYRPNKGCLVILRPGSVHLVRCPLEDYDDVDQSFSGFMVAQTVQ